MIVAIRMGSDDWFEQREMTPQEFCFALSQGPGWVVANILHWRRSIGCSLYYKIVSYNNIPCEPYIDIRSAYNYNILFRK